MIHQTKLACSLTTQADKKSRAFMRGFLLLFFLFSGHLFAEDFFKQTSVKNFIQDQDGYIWSIGQFGLKRFDGKQTISFSNTSQKHKVPFNWVTYATKAGNKFLLATEKQGIWEFNPKDGKARSLDIAPEGKSVYYAKKVHGKALIIYSTENGLFVYNQLQKSTKRIYGKDKTFSFKDAGDFICGRAEDEFIRVDIRNLYAENIVFNTEVKYINTVFGTDNACFYTDAEGIHKMAHGDNVTVTYPTEYPIISVSDSPMKQGLWMLDSNGRLQLRDRETLAIKPHAFEAEELPKATLVYEDISGLVWLATQNGITNHVDRQYVIESMPVISRSLEAYSAFNKVWLGSTSDGMFVKNGDAIEPVEAINKHLEGRARHISGITQVGQKLLFATWDGVYSFDYNTKQLTRLFESLPKQFFLNIRAQEKYIYLACDGCGLAVINAKSLTLEHLFTAEEHGISSNEITDFTVDGRGFLWIASGKGIDRFDVLQQKVVRHFEVSSSKMIAVRESNNKIYAGSFGDGLFILNHDAKLINKVYTGSHISSLETISDKLWVGSRQGLYSVDTHVDVADMLPGSDNLSINGQFTRHNDLIYVGGPQGLVNFSLVKHQPFQPNIVVSEVNVQGKDELGVQKIELDSTSNVVRLYLASLDYRNPDLNRFKYRINNRPWIDAINPILVFTNLEPGEHVIEVRGTNSTGRWSDRHANMRIIVKTPLYWSTPAKVIYVAFISLLIFSIIRFVYVRYTSLSNINNELNRKFEIRRSTLNNIRSDFKRIKEHLGSPDADKDKRIIAICDQAMVALTEQQEEINVPNELEDKRLIDALHFLIEYFYRHYHIRIIHEFDIDVSQLNHDVQADLYKIIYEAMAQTAQHTDTPQIELIARLVDKKVWIFIQEEGKGLNRLTHVSSVNLGLYVLRKVLEKYNGTLEVRRKKPHGTIATLSFTIDPALNRPAATTTRTPFTPPENSNSGS